MCEDPLSYKQEIASWPSKGKLHGIVFAPHFVDNEWGADVCSNKKEGDSDKYSCLSVMLPGSNTGLLLTCQSVSK